MKRSARGNLSDTESCSSGFASPSPLPQKWHDKHLQKFGGLKVTTTNSQALSRHNRHKSGFNSKMNFLSSSSLFRGSDGDLSSTVSKKDLQKYQIDISRSIPLHRVSYSPIKRDIIDINTVCIVRRKGEGTKELFNRPELQNNSNKIEDVRTVVKLNEPQVVRRILPKPASVVVRGGTLASDKIHRRSRSPITKRLTLGAAQMDAKFRSNQHQSVHSRLGEPMQKEELESRRPSTKPWEVDPEVVPRSGKYFMHDSRDANDNGGDNNFRNRRQRYANFAQENRWNRGRRNGRWDRMNLYSDNVYSRKKSYGRESENVWKHDLFDTLEGEEQLQEENNFNMD